MLSGQGRDLLPRLAEPANTMEVEAEKSYVLREA